MDVLQLLGHADGFLQVDAHTKGITTMAAAAQLHNVLRAVGGSAKDGVYCSVGVVNYARFKVNNGRFSAEGTAFPSVVNADSLVVLAIKGYCGLCLCGESEEHQRSRKDNIFFHKETCVCSRRVNIL